MKKAMISLPMAGRTPEEIVAARNKAIHVLEGMGYEVVNTMFTDEWYSPDAMKLRGVVNIPLCFLAKSLGTCPNATAPTSAKGGTQIMCAAAR